jgi:small subunit ribosomal protein S16
LAVKMRLRRVGAKHQPSYRIVVADSRSPRDGRFIDQVGTYNPRTNPATITLNRDKAIEWLRKGAQPTETVEILLKKADIVPSDVRKGEAPAAAGTYAQGPSQGAQQVQGTTGTAATATATAPAATAPTDSDTYAAPEEPATGEVTIEVEAEDIPLPEEGAE